MLGEQIGEFSGIITSQRVLDIKDRPSIEATVNAGNMMNIKVTTTITYWNVRRSSGAMYGEGQGIITTKEGEIATSKAQGVGNINARGDVKWRGSIFYTSSSIGKLSFLNNLVVVFETDVDCTGNVQEKVWEWK